MIIAFTRQLADLHGATLELAFSCAIKERLQDRKDRARTLLAAIRTDIRENLGQEPVTPSATAKRLKINLRVLQELLAAHRASYGELLTEVRMKRALCPTTHRFAEPPVQEIALPLAYDTPLARRHFGVSPRQYRNQH
ncbi:MAG: AraC family transcriptional regulator [Caenibius sp.]